MDVQENDNPPKPLVEASVNDKHFLLNFIMGTYLGPDVITDIPRRSALQRQAESLLPYSLNDLGPSYVTLPQVENIYYYVSRNAHPSAVLNLYPLYNYLKGKLSVPNSVLLEDGRQFTSFFPPDLHEQSRIRSSHKIYKGIVIIDNPDISHIRPDDMERFRQLTGFNDLKIDLTVFQSFHHGYRSEYRESEQSNGNSTASVIRQDGLKKRRLSEPLQVPILPQTVPISVCNHPVEETVPVRSCDLGGPSMVTLVSTPKVEKRNSKTSVVLTGTATEGRVGPPVGLVDVGISRDAYFFRVALPGVKKEQGQFSCEIEHNGKVLVRGVTITGERSILRHSRMFQMDMQQLCPPGPFTISFSLPGPVDPRLFSPNFKADGILEVVVMKYRFPGEQV